MFIIKCVACKGDAPINVGTYSTDEKTATYLAKMLFEHGTVSIPYPVHQVMLYKSGLLIKTFQR